jgi:tetratricopeptide (TPR) repeat protein
MLSWFRTTWILGLATCVFASICVAGENSAELKLPEGEVVYRDYDDANLMRVAEYLYRSHRHSEAVEACEEALGRNLTDGQIAAIKHLLAQNYELIPDRGQDAKDAYLRVIQEHPSYERLPEVAYRLGELNVCIIPRGTDPNIDKGAEYLRLVINQLPITHAGDTAVTYLSLEAHMMLGNLLLVKGQNEEAKACRGSNLIMRRTDMSIYFGFQNALQT